MDIDDLSLKAMASAHSNLTFEGLGQPISTGRPCSFALTIHWKSKYSPQQEPLCAIQSLCACPAKKKGATSHTFNERATTAKFSPIVSTQSLFPTNWPGRGLCCCLITSLGHTAERQQPSKWPECGCSQYSCRHPPVAVKGLDERVRSKGHGEGAGRHSTYIKHLDWSVEKNLSPRCLCSQLAATHKCAAQKDKDGDGDEQSDVAPN